ncbi:MAG TPA: polyprenol monophosphomannose synthase [Actinomycetota bacterium]|nr:polyprenol monophosphomannose synthase [Actinomycetota bacterium]
MILPTLNEGSSIGRVIELLLEGDDSTDVLVVDDASTDDTSAIVGRLRGERVNLIERPSKMGLGSAYLTGFAWALERPYDAVVEMDSDLSHDPRDALRLVAALEHADIVIGSRYVPRGRVENWGLCRRALSLAGNRYAHALLGIDVADSTSGLRAYRAEWLRRADLASISSEGYSFQVEMAYRAVRRGARVMEIPIVFTERVAGRSKMSRAIVAEALVRIALWALRDRVLASLGRRPVRP